MHFFIDESGSFTGVGHGTSLSLIGALIVPDSRRGSLEREFKRLRRSLPQEDGEVKGRKMMEKDVAKVTPLLCHHDVIFEVIGIDLGLHTAEGLRRNQVRRAEAMTNGLTREHSEGATNFAWTIRRELESHSLPLHVQSALMFFLIKRLIEHGSMYWGQRKPRELEYFHWVIDAKGVLETPTAWEQWWSRVIMPWMQTECHSEPIHFFTEADYSYMERFNLADPTPFQTELLRSDPNGPPPVDIKKLMTESLRFSSQAEPGLELVDIVTNATRRALLGRLKPDGWDGIRALMINRSPQNIQIVSLDEAVKDRPAVPYGATLKTFNLGGRSMIANKRRR
ncbi:MAG: hypothetical protein AB7V13_21715 [Pseudorhodoplanes sp.]|uniref:hypothetical protein n=1 Tax=Pseudorhodoplanes sp. TaxID=1934341 RepID=UPI003D135D22